MIKLKYLLFEITDKVKQQFIDKVKKSGYHLTDDQFKYYIDIFEKRKDNRIFPSKDILAYSYDKDNPQKNQFTFKYLENLIDQNFSRESNVKYDANNINSTSNDIIYNQNGITIWDADTKEKCIKYGKYGNNYCVARPDSSNMFDSYRYQKKLTFYFIMDKTKKAHDPFSFFSIAVPDGITPNDKNKDQYYVTDKNNNINTLESWNFIIRNNNNIKDLQDLFKSKPLTPQEYERYNKFKSTIHDDAYKPLSYDDKLFYIQMGHRLSKVKFFASNSKLQDIYIQTGQRSIEDWYDELSMKQKIVANKIHTKKAEELAERYGWEKNIITGKYSTKRYVKIEDKLTFAGKLLIKFDKVRWFNCSESNITSLEGCPIEVEENFDCSHTNITSLEGAPQKVGGYFNCGNTNITSLKGCPKEIGISLMCNKTKITSLEGCPQVGYGIDCSDTNITSLEGAPEKVKFFICVNTKITSLKGAPLRVYGKFDCSNCVSLISLEGAPERVNDFNCSNTAITSLKGAPIKVRNEFRCIDTNIQTLDYLPDGINTGAVPKHLEKEFVEILNAQYQHN